MFREIDFQTLKSLIDSDSTFLLDVYAGWCHPCRLLDRELEEVKSAMPSLEIVRIDYDRTPEIGDLIGIGSLPYLVLYANSSPVLRVKGFYRSGRIIEWIAGKLNGTGSA